VSPAALAALFAVYAAGLVPGLLLGGVASDARGRRPLVLAAAALSPLASVLLLLAPAATWTLVPARALAGVASGVAFAAGSAWLQELSVRAGDGAEAGSRRTALALSAGFAVGPLVSATVAAVAPAPLISAHLPHVLVATATLLLVLAVPEARASGGPRRSLLPAAARGSAFWRTVAPLAPWVFACATTSFAVLPVLLGDVTVAIAGAVTAATLAVGVAVQPVARRMPAVRAGRLGLLAAAGGLVVGALAVDRQLPGLLVVTVALLGAAYGLLLVAGLRITDDLADPAERGALLAVFYALTYAGFLAPSVLDALSRAIDPVPALLVLAGAAFLGVLQPRAVR